jgi:hypothetical protein
LDQLSDRERALRSELERARRLDPGLLLLFVIATVTLGLLALSAAVAIYRMGEGGPSPNQLVLIGIFALLLALMVWAIIRARQPG